MNLHAKTALHKGKFGKFYASREKLYDQHLAFLIPKASPLEASYDLLLGDAIFLLKSFNFRETSNGQYFHGWKWE